MSSKGTIYIHPFCGIIKFIRRNENVKTRTISIKSITVDPLKAFTVDPYKVALYIRWSTDEQGDGTTLEVQKENCVHYVLSQGWQVNPDLIFIDDGWSGGNLEPPRNDPDA